MQSVEGFTGISLFSSMCLGMDGLFPIRSASDLGHHCGGKFLFGPLCLANLGV